MNEFSPEKFVDMLDLLGRGGRIEYEKLMEYLHTSGRDGDMYIEEAVEWLRQMVEDLSE